MALVAGQIPVSGYRIPDYSGAAAAGGAAAAAPYQMISGLAGQAKDYFKEQGEKKKLVKQSSLQIDAALQLFPDLAPSFQGLKERMKDENIPLADRAAEAEVVANLINMGVGEMRNRASMSFQQQQAMADAIMKQQQLGLQERQVQASEYKASQTGKPSYEIKKATVTTPTGEVLERDMPFNPKTGRFFDAAVGKEILDINAWGLGQPAYAEDMPPTSQVGGGSSDMIAQVAEMNLGQPISAKTPGTQGGKLGCADAVCKLVKQATGEEIGTLSTAEMVSKLSRNPKFESVPIGQAQRGDIIVTPRGNRAGHAGVFLDSRSIASNSSAGFRGGSPGTLQQNYTLGTWMNSIDSRNPGKTQVFRYTGGDAASQAMGTPEQQAEIARMIQEGAGMATAQMIPRGSMPTEPRMAQPQPSAQQAQQYQVRPGFVPVKPNGGQKEAKIITGEEAKALNLDPLGTYEASYQDGQLTGVQTIKAAPSVGDIIAMEKRAEEKAAKQELNEAVKAKSERMISLMTELRNHPGFGGLFGVGYTGIPGTESANAKVLYDQIQAQGFMEAIKDMKGMGALSNAEGEKASAAFVGINPSMSESAALARIDEVVKYIKEGQKRIQSGNLIETKENKGSNFKEINDYYRNLQQSR
jgi:hypothetical protein